MSARRSRTRVAAAGPARRPRRPARHRLLRPVLGAALIVAGVVTPIGSGDLPEPLRGVAGETTVLAQDQGQQPAITDGRPNDCPQDPVPYKPSRLAGGEDRRLVHPGTGDDPDGFPLCGLETPACPKDPTIDPATVTDDTVEIDDLFLRPSMQLPGGGTDSQGNPLYVTDSQRNPVYRYPGFCEERYLRSARIDIPPTVGGGGGDAGGNPAVDPGDVSGGNPDTGVGNPGGGNPAVDPGDVSGGTPDTGVGNPGGGTLIQIPGDDEAYAKCENATGFVRMIHVMPVLDDDGDRRYYDDDGDPDTPDVLITQSMCRLIHPPFCVAGLHRVGSDTCRAVVRRTWRCPDGYVPRNEFNTCYKEPEMAGATPACGPGAPEFVAQDCRDYVGEDYERNPHTVDCAAIDVGKSLKNLAEKESGPANPYWCQFARSYLNVECHETPPGGSCTERPLAYCLKRASETGGCHAIAHTLNCRALQAAFKEGATAQEVRNEGCQPCILLPFEPPPSDSNACPPDLTESPSAPPRANEKLYNALWRERRSLASWELGCASDIDTDQPLDPDSVCLTSTTCSGSSLGVLTWTSGHHSGLAIVNSPVVLTVEDVPTAGPERIVPQLDFNFLEPSLRQSFLEFDDVGDEYGVALHTRVWPQLDPQMSYTQGFVRAFIDDDLGGGCIYPNPIRFRIIVEELWPDIPKSRDRISELFGGDALAWWYRLDQSLQQAYTEARDLAYWDDTQVFDNRIERENAIERALQARSRNIEEVICNVGDTIWCRWYPTRPGFYELRGASASEARYYLGPPQWKTRNLAFGLASYFNNRGNKDRTRDVLDAAGLTANPERAGIDASLTSHLPLDTDAEMLLTEAFGLGAVCPTIDVRIYCRASKTAGIYEETESIGIQVHEIRVATRAPNTP